MPTCFVIQPFDGGAFDKRYDDVFVPAIKDAGLDPYRVDRDPAALIPIEEIEEGIRRADVCLADISLPNPNVWFEVGFAIAAGKAVILASAHDPNRRFPFDIQHRAVISYRTESARDFQELGKQISERLRAALRKEDTLGRLAGSAVVADVEGLNPFEIVALATIAANASAPDDTVSVWAIRQDMDRAGYTRVACTLSLGSLLAKGMVESHREEDRDGDIFTSFSVTHRGFDWLLKNQDRLVLRRPDGPVESPLGDDDLPF